MNRCTPLITRRVGRMAIAPPCPLPRPVAAQNGGGGEDIRLFLTGWLGGLVFFGTFLA